MTFTRSLIKQLLKYSKSVSHYVIHEKKKTNVVSKPYINRHIKQLILGQKKMLKLYKRYRLTYCSARKACRNKVDIKVRNTRSAYLKGNLKRIEQTQKKKKNVEINAYRNYLQSTNSKNCHLKFSTVTSDQITSLIFTLSDTGPRYDGISMFVYKKTQRLYLQFIAYI